MVIKEINFSCTNQINHKAMIPSLRSLTFYFIFVNVIHHPSGGHCRKIITDDFTVMITAVYTRIRCHVWLEKAQIIPKQKKSGREFQQTMLTPIYDLETKMLHS
jgi:hypothetical protein